MLIAVKDRADKQWRGDSQLFCVGMSSAKPWNGGLKLFFFFWESKFKGTSGIVSDSNNIFWWHESGDINKNGYFSKFQLISFLRLQVMHDSCTPRTLHTCCSQSKFRILNIRESSVRALFLYNCTPNISSSADVSVSVA